MNTIDVEITSQECSKNKRHHKRRQPLSYNNDITTTYNHLLEKRNILLSYLLRIKHTDYLHSPCPSDHPRRAYPTRKLRPVTQRTLGTYSAFTHVYTMVYTPKKAQQLGFDSSPPNSDSALLRPIAALTTTPPLPTLRPHSRFPNRPALPCQVCPALPPSFCTISASRINSVLLFRFPELHSLSQPPG
jgi:hypothetical protein